MPEHKTQAQYDWCRTIPYYSTTLLLTRGYDTDEEMYYMALTMQADHILGDRTVAGEMSSRMYHAGDEPFSEQAWGNFVNEDNARAYADRLIQEIASQFSEAGCEAVH